MWQLKVFKNKSLNVGVFSSKLNKIALCLVLAMSAFILFAASAKFFFPSSELYILDYSVSCFEVIFIAILFVYRRRFEMWLAASLIFASWAGYALFWYIIELPCLCMGTAVTIPDGFSLVLDAVFYLISLSMLFVLGAPQRWLILNPVIATLFLASGFAFAQWIYAIVLAD